MDDHEDCVPKEVFSLYCHGVEKDISNVTDSFKREIETIEEKIEAVRSSLEDIQNERTWMIRLVLGAVILAVVSLVVTNGDFTK